jgi:hypothetical protein
MNILREVASNDKSLFSNFEKEQKFSLLRSKQERMRKDFENKFIKTFACYGNHSVYHPEPDSDNEIHIKFTSQNTFKLSISGVFPLSKRNRKNKSNIIKKYEKLFITKVKVSYRNEGCYRNYGYSDMIDIQIPIPNNWEDNKDLLQDITTLSKKLGFKLSKE